VVFHLSHAHVVAIYELVEFRSQGVQKILDRSGELFHLAGASVGRGDVPAERLDMDIHVRGAVAQLADAFFEFAGLTMRFPQARVFIHFEVQFDEQLSGVLQRRDVVNGQAHALRDRANGFKQMLTLGSAGLGVHHDVRRDDFADALFDGVAQGVHLLETGGARHADRGIDEMAVAGAAHAHAVDVQDSVHARHGHGDFLLQTLGGNIEQRIQGSPAELRANPQNDGGNGQAGESVRVSEPGQAPGLAGPD